MTKNSTPHGSKNLLIVIVLIVAAAAGFGYYNQSSELESDASANAAEAGEAVTKTPPAPNHAIFKVQSDDIVVGAPTAPVTIIEYASLSCPHCAQFYQDIFPKVKRDLIDTGKARFVYRHFALNEPALRAAQVVECADKGKREALVKTLFETQKDWAFEAKFIAALKPIAALGGIDAAQFDSCIADKNLENKILATRMQAANVALVNSTPSFFVNGVRLDGTVGLKELSDAVAKAK
jgi:protein-disulfide isomerase